VFSQANIASYPMQDGTSQSAMMLCDKTVKAGTGLTYRRQSMGKGREEKGR